MLISFFMPIASLYVSTDSENCPHGSMVGLLSRHSVPLQLQPDKSLHSLGSVVELQACAWT